jgi:hypothetical protein
LTDTLLTPTAGRLPSRRPSQKQEISFMTERTKLSDILQQNSDRERLASLWKTTAAAAEFAPLPKGDYPFRILAGALFISKRGTPGYKLTLEVVEGEFQGRRAWVDFWLTPAALPMTKRDLAKIGVTDLEQLERPLPPGILIRGKLIVRQDDQGIESNQLRHFDYIGIEPGDPFAPPEDGGDQPGAREVSGTDAVEAPPSPAEREQQVDAKPPATNPRAPSMFDGEADDENGPYSRKYR